MNTLGVLGPTCLHSGGITRDLQIDRIENLRWGMVKPDFFYIELSKSWPVYILQYPSSAGPRINFLLDVLKQSKSEYMSWNCPVIPEILSTFFLKSGMPCYVAADASKRFALPSALTGKVRYTGWGCVNILIVPTDICLFVYGEVAFWI